MYKIIWSNRSLIDLYEIKEFISKGSTKYAKITINSIIDSLNFIENNSYFGRIVPGINDVFFWIKH